MEAAHIYGLLREAWERLVEEVLLYGVVERYRRPVETHRVKKLVDITEDDVKAVDDGMTKCSRWLTGHDQPAVEDSPFPDSEELAADIGALDEFRKSLAKRRR